MESVKEYKSLFREQKSVIIGSTDISFPESLNFTFGVNSFCLFRDILKVHQIGNTIAFEVKGSTLQINMDEIKSYKEDEGIVTLNLKDRKQIFIYL